MYEQKTKPTELNVEDFLNAISDEDQRQDAKAICQMMREVSGLAPKIWGTSIVGFGAYHYKYASGHEGDAALIGFSPRKGNTTIYLINGFARYRPLLEKLGKHKTGVACLYIKRLSDIDNSVLKELMTESLKCMKETYPAWKNGA